MVASIDLAASGRVLELSERALAASPKQWRKAANRTMKRAVRSGKAAMSTDIRKEINLKKKAVDSRIRTKIVSERALLATVSVRDARVPLVDFMTSGQIATAYRRQRAKRSKGVPIKVFKNKGRQVYEGAFVQIGKRSGRWHVLSRVDGAGRYPARIQYGPRLTQFFQKRLPAFAEQQAAVLDATLERELKFAFRDL